MPKVICKNQACNKLVEKEEKYCSIHIKDYEKKKKDSHKWYKKNRTDYWEQKFYNSIQWKKMSTYIRDRDMYVCQLCLRDKCYGAPDVVHHIIELKEDKTVALNSENLICLCTSCHNKVHAMYRNNKNITQENLREIVRENPLQSPLPLG